MFYIVCYYKLIFLLLLFYFLIIVTMGVMSIYLYDFKNIFKNKITVFSDDAKPSSIANNLIGW